MMVIYESNMGIVFELTQTTNRCKITVKNKESRFIHQTYRFDNVPFYEHPYLSWENLNCCGGWMFDTRYLLDAVPQEKKLCAGLTFDEKKLQKEYIEYLDTVKLPYHIPIPRQNGSHTWYYVDVVREGSLSDYFSFDEIKEVYARHRIHLHSSSGISEYMKRPMIELLKGYNGYDYGNAQGMDELIITGLLLGYPIESTVSLLQGY